MGRSFNKYLFPVMITLSLIFLLSSTVSAHRMIVEPVEEGIVKVIYDGGRIARRAEVVVYDEAGREIARGGLDEKGYFHYPLVQGDVQVVADDGLGHRAEWKTGDSHGDGLSRAVTVLLVLLGFVIIALVFHYRVKNKEAFLSIESQVK